MRYYLHYSIPVLQQALYLWLIVAVVVFPATWWFSRRCTVGAFIRRLGAVALVSFYVIGLISYTFLPLPDRSSFTCTDRWGGAYPRFFLGWSLQFALREHGSLVEALFSTYILQMFLNVLLFVPFGVFAYLFWRASFRAVLLAAFGVSLVVELTQLTGIWGYYGCAVRTFDAEDLFNNTLGAVLGWCALVCWYQRGQLGRLMRGFWGR